MTSLSNLKKDLPKILSEADWLIQMGFIHQVENEYTIRFWKDEISISVYYGRYSDVTDVFIKIDSSETDRYENGSPVQYSVFEVALVDSTIGNPSLSDGFETAKAGIDMLKHHKQLFDIRYLKDIKKKYRQILSAKLPENLRNLT